MVLSTSGSGGERARVINSILVAGGRQAATYDPQFMSASDFVRRSAEAEEGRLREALDAAGSMGQLLRR